MLAQVLKASHSVPVDIIGLVVLFILFFIYSVYFGRNKTVALVFSYYPAVLLYQSFPFVNKVILAGHSDLFTLGNKLVVFLIFFFPLNIIISRYIFIESVHLGKPGMMHNVHIFRNIGLSLVCVTLTLVFLHTIVDISSVHQFSSWIEMLFSTPNRLWLANLGPRVLLAFL